MNIFRYPEDRLPTALIISITVADLLVFWFVRSPWWVIAWMLVTLLAKSMVCAWNHHHQHVPTFRMVWLNRLMEIVYALQTGISTNGWVLHHNLGHHLNYLDQSKDESAWKDRSGKPMGTLRYTATVALTGYWRAYLAGRRHPKYQRGFLSGAAITAFILLLLATIDWLNTLILFLVPMAAGLFVTAWHTYYHHAGLDTDDPFRASHNIMNRWYNIFTGNLGYHTAHHLKPGLHWSRLPEFHATIAHNIPPELFVHPCPPFRWIPDSSGRAVFDWRHPRRAETNGR